jgi:mono/diheme cytochrome c family protein
MKKKNVWTFVIIVVVVLVVCPLLLQLVPYGHSHTNPPVVSEPKWDSPQTRALAVRACFDCHSNETKWPWYTNIAPVSWLIQRDVDDGRRRLNFSDWGAPTRGEARNPSEMGRAIQRGSMPPWFYLPPHPEAQLTQAEKDQLIQGLQTTLSTP